MRREILDRLVADLEAKRPVVVATHLATGEARLVHPYADEPDVAPALRAAARDAADRDESAKLETAGGTVFLAVHNPPVRVLVVGAVHIAQSLARMVQLAGYDVLVVDPRRSFATEDRFRDIPLTRDWPDEVAARVGLDRRSAVVTMTHDPKIDDPAIAAALRSQAFYIGALGSKKTQAARRERLRAMGFGDADLERLHGPVGLSIGAVSPGEIAVSILSQLVQCLRRPKEQARTAA